MIRNRWQPSSYISYILTVSPASFNFCLIGHPNEKKKKKKKKKKKRDGLQIYFVPQDRVHWVKRILAAAP